LSQAIPFVVPRGFINFKARFCNALIVGSRIARPVDQRLDTLCPKSGQLTRFGRLTKTIL
jgi:hypothetical protein